MSYYILQNDLNLKNKKNLKGLRNVKMFMVIFEFPDASHEKKKVL